MKAVRRQGVYYVGEKTPFAVQVKVESATGTFSHSLLVLGARCTTTAIKK